MFEPGVPSEPQSPVAGPVEVPSAPLLFVLACAGLPLTALTQHMSKPTTPLPVSTMDPTLAPVVALFVKLHAPLYVFSEPSTSEILKPFPPQPPTVELTKLLVHMQLRG